MGTFLITFGVFIAVIVALALGYIFQNKALKGSCGGLGAVGVDKVCSCKDTCEAPKNK